jgi:hypothetical protein
MGSLAPSGLGWIMTLPGSLLRFLGFEERTRRSPPRCLAGSSDDMNAGKVELLLAAPLRRSPWHAMSPRHSPRRSLAIRPRPPFSNIPRGMSRRHGSPARVVNPSRYDTSWKAAVLVHSTWNVASATTFRHRRSTPLPIRHLLGRSSFSTFPGECGPSHVAMSSRSER